MPSPSLPLLTGNSHKRAFTARLLFRALMGIRTLVLLAYKCGAPINECRARVVMSELCREGLSHAGRPERDKMSELKRSKRLFNLAASGLLQSNRYI